MVYQQELSDGNKEYGMIINENNAYYFLEGIIEEEEFIKIVCGIKLFE